MAGDLSAGASILTGFNPLTDNLSLFLVQLLIIICLSRLIGAGLAYLHQPRVIAEVIVGILLGPSALSRIPAFANNVFPASSKPLLKLVADFGLVLFLFLVGLEIDPRSLLKSAKIATSISLAGIAVPFALGVGVSKLIYELIEIPDVLEAGKAAPPFLSFTLFIGCAMSITAFPVLARMLTERKLLGTKVGQATMAAAAVDDVMAWILLILVVALINNPANSIVAVYVFLLVVAWFIFLWFAVRPVIVRIVKYNNPDPNSHEISPFTIFAMFFVVIVSATFAQILGIHAIFGAFLAGIIMPHEDGFAAKITEKIEDLVSVLFLPLYFTYSGLNTRIDQLSDGLTWAMVVLVIATAMVGKIFGCMLASKITGLTWRESWTVGFLMSTKGLVELIVLNLGLSAGVISVRVFTICVVMALVTTFVTMPVVTFIYPTRFYLNLKPSDEQAANTPGQLQVSGGTGGEAALRPLITLTRVTSVAPMMAFTRLLHSATQPESHDHHHRRSHHSMSPLQLHVLRLIPLTERYSDVLRAYENTEKSSWDSLLNVFEIFSQILRINIQTYVTIVPESEFGEHVAATAHDTDANVIVISLNPSVQLQQQGSTSPQLLTTSSTPTALDIVGLAGHFEKLLASQHVLATVAMFLERDLPTPSHQTNVTIQSHHMTVNTRPVAPVGIEVDRIVVFYDTGAPDAHAALRLSASLAGKTTELVVVSHTLDLETDSIETVDGETAQRQQEPDGAYIRKIKSDGTNVRVVRGSLASFTRPLVPGGPVMSGGGRFLSTASAHSPRLLRLFGGDGVATASQAEAEPVPTEEPREAEEEEESSGSSEVNEEKVRETDLVVVPWEVYVREVGVRRIVESAAACPGAVVLVRGPVGDVFEAPDGEEKSVKMA